MKNIWLLGAAFIIASCSSTHRFPAGADIGTISADGKVVLAKMEENLIVVMRCEDYTDLEKEACNPKEKITLSENHFLEIAKSHYKKLRSPRLNISSEEYDLYGEAITEDTALKGMEQAVVELERKIAFSEKYLKNDPNLPGWKKEHRQYKFQIANVQKRNSMILSSRKKIDDALAIAAQGLLDRIKLSDLEMILYDDVQKKDDMNLIHSLFQDITLLSNYSQGQIYGKCSFTNLSGLYVMRYEEIISKLIYFKYDAGKKEASDFTLEPRIGVYPYRNYFHTHEEAHTAFSKLMKETNLCRN